MLWYPLILTKNLSKKINIENRIINEKHNKIITYFTTNEKELNNIINTYDLDLLQINNRTNELYYIQHNSKYIYKITKINGVYFVNVE